MARGCCSAPVGLAFRSVQGHSGTGRALRVDEVTVDAGTDVREAIDETVVDDHSERLGEDVRFAAAAVFRDGSRCCLADNSTGSATLQRSRFAVLGACGGHPKTRRCARPARWSAGRLRRIAGLLTRAGQQVLGADALSPVRDHPAYGRVGWRRAGTPRLLAGHARPGRRCPAPQAGWTCLPGAGPTRTRDCAQQSGGPCASSVTPNPGAPMLAYGRWHARTGIRSSSGRARPVPATPSVGPARCATGWSSPLRITDPRVSNCWLAVVGEGFLATACELPIRAGRQLLDRSDQPLSGTTGGRPRSRSGRDSSQSNATAWASPPGPEGRVYRLRSNRSASASARTHDSAVRADACMTLVRGAGGAIALAHAVERGNRIRDPPRYVQLRCWAGVSDFVCFRMHMSSDSSPFRSSVSVSPAVPAAAFDQVPERRVLRVDEVAVDAGTPVREAIDEGCGR